MFYHNIKIFFFFFQPYYNCVRTLLQISWQYIPIFTLYFLLFNFMKDFYFKILPSCCHISNSSLSIRISWIAFTGVLPDLKITRHLWVKTFCSPTLPSGTLSYLSSLFSCTVAYFFAYQCAYLSWVLICCMLSMGIYVKQVIIKRWSENMQEIERSSLSGGE